MNIYDFTVKARDGSDVSLADYKGKVLLVVNTATGCGFTPQYTELQELYDRYKDQGFEILDFPCNQFANQAPGDDEEIHTFCTGRFGIKFPQFAKIDVNGENAIPLYQWLTSTTKFEGFNGPGAIVLNGVVKKMDKDYKNNGNIKWNFTKFLIDREGNIVQRFEPTNMKELEDKIKACL
ncbi:MAG: glutathione peroxidase [Erysipelotrichaceae bacterium]|nr:glutathione peroxidase [Erysipelotrichaceae bacterium]MBR0462722.1 glutathione peroxidase [Erysipelotrichaceae bacterium]